MQIKQTILGFEPVTLAEAKAWLKIDFDTEDDLILDLITGIRQKIEEFTGLSLVEKKIEIFVDGIPRELELPYPPHKDLLQVKVAGVETTSFQKAGLNQIVLKGLGAITASTEVDNSIYVAYTTTGECPAAIKNAIKKTIDEQYRNRGNTFEGSIVQLSESSYLDIMQFVRE